MRIMLHTKNRGDELFGQTQMRDFPQVPQVGDYVAVGSKGELHRIEMVVYTPFEGEHCVARIFAVASVGLNQLELVGKL